MMRKTIARGQYGEISTADPLYSIGRKLILRAIAQGKLSPEHVDFDHHRRGTAQNYDVYDVQVRPFRILIQDRYTTGDKYGLHPVKRYYTLTMTKGRRIIVRTAPAPDQVVKKAKADEGRFRGGVIRKLDLISLARRRRVARDLVAHGL
ncbi:MAG: hypothetical protein ACSLE1_15900 [Sphingobium sp.]